ncbi:hypothetical protein B7R54_06395 [Subtercola boreus]|uniref:Thiol reductant ABC exporter subunit CydC n=1 Tax=Subtercola boreus TaxID=120213 RepID=A0A3E0VGZ0_9MICO|nr:ATP-binding cassette domain-containing protein [Subtercola boreus]RFA08895.1 hypothetical protein B7R54_06395 [Subtercola boreus]TQL54124.1 ABC transporter transmembrane protein [Subtercola boreus]
MRTADVLRLAQPTPRAFAPALVFGLLSALSTVALLGTSAYLIARAAEQPPILYLSIAIVGVRGFALARASFRYLDRLAGHSAAFRALASLRVAIYERIVPLAPAGLAGTRRGDLLARLVGDVDELQNLPLRVVQPLVTSLLVSALAVVGVSLLLPAAGITLAVALLLALVAGTFVNSRIAGSAERELAPLRGRLTDETLDLVGNLDVLVAFGAVDDRLARLEQTDARLTRSATSRAAGAGATAAVVSLLAGLATVAALVVGIPALGAAVIAGSTGADTSGLFSGTSGSVLTGPVLAVLALVPIAVFEVFAAVPLAAGAWRQVHASAARVAAALPDALPPELPAAAPRDGLRAAETSAALPAAETPAALPGAVPRAAPPAPEKWSSTATTSAPSLPASARGADATGAEGDTAGGVRAVPVIRLDRVSARWPQLVAPSTRATQSTQATQATSATPSATVAATAPDGAAAALRDVSVTIRPGERLLVTGPSGSGKTTLAAVLVRFLEHSGSFTIDGVDVRTLAPEAVRQMIGLCEQSPYIFDANLRQNLLFAREAASDDELLTVLDRVGLTTWAVDRGGLDAALGQHGALVSGGEAQRIALARVLLADFPVVVLDEPTANVDPARADALLGDLLAAAGPGRSIVLISHTDVPPDLVTRRLRLG